MNERDQKKMMVDSIYPIDQKDTIMWKIMS